MPHSSRFVRERQDWLPYFRAIADRICLRDWTIQIHDDPAQPGHFAEVERIQGRWVAMIKLGDSFMKDKESGQRDTAAHELIHLHLAFADDMAEMAMSKEGWESYRRFREYAVDHLASAIAPMLPLPSAILNARKSSNPAKRTRKSK